MIATATILAAVTRFGGSALTYIKDTAWPFLKENWKQVSWAALFLWFVMCLLTHCTGMIDPWRYHPSEADTTRTVQVDTVLVYPDTAAIFVLYGFDTLPNHVKNLQNRLRFRSTPPVFLPDASCRDSVVVLRSHSELLTHLLSVCDSAYEDAVAVRSYGDTLRNDSIEVTIGFRVQGHLQGEPSINYRYLAPYPVVTIKETIEINNPPPPPKRRVYLEGGIGVVMTWENDLNAISGSVGLGYENRKGWSFGPRGTFNQNFYMVEGTVRKSFGVGKK